MSKKWIRIKRTFEKVELNSSMSEMFFKGLVNMFQDLQQTEQQVNQAAASLEPYFYAAQHVHHITEMYAHPTLPRALQIAETDVYRSGFADMVGAEAQANAAIRQAFSEGNYDLVVQLDAEVFRPLAQNANQIVFNLVTALNSHDLSNDAEMLHFVGLLNYYLNQLN